MIQVARDAYAKSGDAIGLEQLQLVENQICGTWKWWRATVGVIWIFVMALALVMPAENITIGRVNLPWGFVQAVSILIWVLLMQIWHWYLRVVTRVGVDTLENLRDKYNLTPLAAPH